MTGHEQASSAADGEAVLRRRLLYRATHRGTREMDWLLGKYVTARLALCPASELPGIAVLVELPDPELHGWILEPATQPDGRFAGDVAAIRVFHGLDGGVPA